MRSGLFVTLYAALLAVGFVFVDREVSDFFYHIKNTDFVYVMKYVTRLGEPTLYLAVAGIVYLVHRKSDRPYTRMARFFIAAVLLSGVIVNVFKGVIGRYRPSEWIKSQTYGFDNFSFLEYTANSFPSGHSTTAFAVGVSLALLFPKYRLWFLLAAAAVASTRVVLYQHYVTDVMAGALVGGITAYTLYRKMILNTIILHKKD